jgi:hypothetical protein
VAGAAWPGRGTSEEQRVTADWTRREEGLADGDREYVFSFERAALIARNEVANVESLGIATGLAEAGVERVIWTSYPEDGRSGEREHWRMNEHPPITVEAMQGTDETKWFVLPSGIAAPYPRWTGLPAKEAINCRCFLAPA